MRRVERKFRIILSALLVSCLSCVTVNSGPEPMSKVPGKRTAEQVQRAVAPLAFELARLLTGDTATAKTKASVWRKNSNYVTPNDPPAVVPFASRILTELYVGLPDSLLFRVWWDDSLRTLSSLDIGVIVNRQRAAELAWLVDSLAYSNTRARYSDVYTRRPGDLAVLLMISHELAHFPIDRLDRGSTTPVSIKECAADIISGFQFAVLTPRLSSTSGFELQESNVVARFGGLLEPGGWIAREEHPDSDQRRACLSRGSALYADQAQWTMLAGRTLLRTKQDTLADALSSGRLSLSDVALEESRQVLTVPTEATTPSAQRPPEFPSRETAIVIRVLDSLLTRTDSLGYLDRSLGPRLGGSHGLFPPGVLHELTLSIPRPWRCGVTAVDSGRVRAAACYVIDNSSFSRVSIDMDWELRPERKFRGFSVQRLKPPVANQVGIRFSQWLLEDRYRRVLISVYDEPHGERKGDRFSFVWGPPRLLWFSYESIGPSPDR